MPNKIVEVEMMFIRGGVSDKTKKPYLLVSNGRKELYINIPNGSDVTAETFEKYNEGDTINLKVSVLVGSDTVTLVQVI